MADPAVTRVRRLAGELLVVHIGPATQREFVHPDLGCHVVQRRDDLGGRADEYVRVPTVDGGRDGVEDGRRVPGDGVAGDGQRLVGLAGRLGNRHRQRQGRQVRGRRRVNPTFETVTKATREIDVVAGHLAHRVGVELAGLPGERADAVDMVDVDVDGEEAFGLAAEAGTALDTLDADDGRVALVEAPEPREVDIGLGVAGPDEESRRVVVDDGGIGAVVGRRPLENPAVVEEVEGERHCGQ